MIAYVKINLGAPGETRVEVNGQDLSKFVTKLDVTADSTGAAKVTFEVLAKVDLSGVLEADFAKKLVDVTPLNAAWRNYQAV